MSDDGQPCSRYPLSTSRGHTIPLRLVGAAHRGVGLERSPRLTSMLGGAQKHNPQEHLKSRKYGSWSPRKKSGRQGELVVSTLKASQWWGGRPENKIDWREGKWSPRGKTGLPPSYHLPSKENKVCTKNKPTRMQNESSGGKARSWEPRNPTVEHQTWYTTTKVVSRTTVSF
ncbi:hypothetical protein CsSME_00018702 [Camellia sinensis var. sinensis]